MEQSIRRLASFVTKKKFAGGALAVVGILIWFLMPFGRDAALADFLSEQGYWETVSPAESYLPGIINTIEVKSDGKIAIHPTCEIDPDLLARMTKHSQTVDRTLEERLNKGFDVSELIKQLLPIGLEGHKVKKLKLSLQNSSILQITDEELMLVRKEVIKGSCQEAIEWNINSGAAVCQTRAALMGDLVYDITYEAGVSAHEKKAADSTLKENQGKADQMGGKGLIYGVNFVPRGILLNTPDPKPADCQVGSRNKA
jgi:hypothetical protein